MRFQYKLILVAASIFPAACTMNADEQAQSKANMGFAPEVAALLAGSSPHSKLGQSFVRFSAALVNEDLSQIDNVVTADARFHELEQMGLPAGPEGLKIFRKQMNAAFPDERCVIAAMRFEGADIIETDLDCTATHLGEVLGIPATGNKVQFRIHTRDRFVSERVAERWDTMDVDDLVRQLKAP